MCAAFSLFSNTLFPLRERESRAHCKISHNAAGTQITGYLIAVITINCHVQLKRDCRLCRQAYRYYWAFSELVYFSNVIAFLKKGIVSFDYTLF